MRADNGANQAERAPTGREKQSLEASLTIRCLKALRRLDARERGKLLRVAARMAQRRRANPTGSQVPKLAAREVAAIQAALSEGKTVRQIAHSWNVSRQTVSKIGRGFYRGSGSTD